VISVKEYAQDLGNLSINNSLADGSRLFLRIFQKFAYSMIIRRLKTLTTHRVWKYHEHELKKHFWNERTFWSDGYFACSVGDASTKVIRAYRENQL